MKIIIESKKSSTGPTERTPKPEYLIARSQLPYGSVGKVPFNFWWIEIPCYSWVSILHVVWKLPLDASNHSFLRGKTFTTAACASAHKNDPDCWGSRSSLHFRSSSHASPDWFTWRNEPNDGRNVIQRLVVWLVNILYIYIHRVYIYKLIRGKMNVWGIIVRVWIIPTSLYRDYIIRPWTKVFPTVDGSEIW